MPDLLTVITKCLPFLESSMFIKYFKKKPEVIQNIAESDYTYMWILDKRGIDSIRMHSISISQSSIMWKETEKLNI